MSYLIEKAIPIPKKKQSELARTLMEMDIGDSILVPYQEQHKLASACLYVAYQTNGLKFSRRSLPDGVRVWRIS